MCRPAEWGLPIKADDVSSGAFLRPSNARPSGRPPSNRSIAVWILGLVAYGFVGTYAGIVLIFGLASLPEVEWLSLGVLPVLATGLLVGFLGGLFAIRQQRSPIRSLIPAWAILILAVLAGAIAISGAT